MTLSWNHETNPCWDEGKEAVCGAAPEGSLGLAAFDAGAPVPGEWWRVEDDGETVGYGWMDTTWGDAQILLAVKPEKARHGVGTYILDQLEQEAHRRGLNYMWNTVQPTHPDREGVAGWLQKRKFAEDGEGSLRRPVGG